MKQAAYRLPADAPHGFGGGELDRSSPLSFRLDGRVIHGFAGDTVLSAVLAAGIDTAGQRAGQQLALNEDFAPPVVPVGFTGDPARALPMQRTPAADGMDLATLGARLGRNGMVGRIRRLFFGPGRSLNQRLDGPAPLQAPWLQLAPEPLADVDTLVIGGGLAGMSAALAAAAAGDRVALVERRPMLGGVARFFGAVGDEEPPAAVIARLSEAVAQASGITVLLRAEALTASFGRIRIHQVASGEVGAISRVFLSTPKRVVLATGAMERLPVFPGNRLPGVVGALAAFTRAERYGIWQGRRALFSTTRNTGYRLAMFAKDAGVDVQRVVDTRLNPQSRFIDFTKASGITSASGLVVREAQLLRKRAGLAASFAVAIEDIDQDTAPIVTDQIVVAGGWQPDLSLWVTAGGSCDWSADAVCIKAGDGPAWLAIAGSAAGWLGHGACQQSGNAAIAKLLGRPVPEVEDPQIDSIYETPDGPTPIAPGRRRTAGHTYLDHGRSLTTRPVQRRGGHQELPFGAGHALSLSDVAAAVQIGAVPTEHAGVLAMERCLGAGDIRDTGWRVDNPTPPGRKAPVVPGYLAGRFGPKPQLKDVQVEDGRAFEPGCLVFADSDSSDPRQAVGVIVAPAAERRSGGVALVARLPKSAQRRFFVRDSSGPVPVQLADRHDS